MKINIDKKITDVIARDKKVIFETTRENFPFVAESANGDYTYDISGNRFIDFSSYIGVYTLGDNANNEIRTSIKRQVDKLMHAAFLDFYSELPVTFAEKLVKHFPNGFGRVFFSNSGTEANEDAIKLAKIFTGKQFLMSFYNGFHGRSLGSLALTSSKQSQKRHMGPFSDYIHVPYPNTYRNLWRTSEPKEVADACLSFIETNVLKRDVSSEDIAAIFLEPVQGEGGIIVPPKEFVVGIRKMATENNMLLVDDEIQAGYMRTGKFLALDNFGVTADVYTMAKALGAGIPIGATIAKSSLGDVPHGSHAGTFGGNLVAMAAANASIDYVDANKNKLESDVKRKSQYIMKRLEEMKDKYEIVGDVRGLGLMIGAELVKNKKTKEPATDAMNKVIDACFNNGLLLLPAGVSTIRIMPPIPISVKNLEKGMDILEEAIKISNVR